MQYKGVLIAVSDIECSKNFYTTVLGLNIESDIGVNVTLSDGVFLQTIETWRNFTGKDQTTFYNNVVELYFETDNFDEFIEKLPNVKLVHSPLEHSWGQRAIRFYDPDGHIIEVGENMQIVIQRFLNSGMTITQTAKRMDVPEEYITKNLPTSPKQTIQLQKMIDDLMAEQEKITQQLTDLKTQGKEKTARFKQLFTKKLSNMTILNMLQNYGLI